MTKHDLGNQARDARIAVDDLTAEQTKVDADVEQVKTRRDRDRNRMDQGLVSNPKDLERMQQEMTSLQRRISTLEDDELEVMERLEEAQATLTRVADQLAEAEERSTRLEQARGSGGRSPRRCPRTCWPSTTGCGPPRAESAQPRCAPGSAAAACSASTTRSWR